MRLHIRESVASLAFIHAKPALSACLALSLLVAGGCSDLTSLKQENPGQIDAGSLYIPANAQLLVNGAIADFECAFSSYVVGSGLLGDELINAIAQTGNYDYDRRTLTPTGPYVGGCGNPGTPGIYTALQTARGTADTAYAKLAGWSDAEVPQRTRMMGQLAAYAGYSLVLLGESMCSAAINLGPELQPAQLFEEARSRFDVAIDAATTANDETTLNFARLGRARALLDLGDLPDAEADAASIPANFVVSISTDAIDPRRQNAVYVHTTQGFFGSVDPSFRELTLDGNPDPRVLVTNTGNTGSAANTPIWTADKYPTITTPIPIARYAEAQLIVAEARLAAHDIPGAVDAINAARNSGGRVGMPAYDATGKTEAEVKSQLIEERRRELFLEGHRFGDVRRYDLPLVPAPGSPYPAGGGAYGDQACFPLPDVERNNNPNI
ncbi:MAG TPA: RagB/SusD family nutrient uptake outer membrane protein [Gemmatimonadaceae bacterium]|nr:RagB/SusD family nutrient uptake outer membrane protein [Gemmatimonadaceae bacterium]